jgi:hypothetical protein
MAIEYPGNAIPAPAYTSPGGQTIDDELFFSMGAYTQKGVTLKPGQGVLLLGTLIKQDPTSKQYIVAAGGTGAQGFLRNSTDTGTDVNGQAWLGNIVYGGILRLSVVEAANSGVTLSGILGGEVNTVAGFFKF